MKFHQLSRRQQDAARRISTKLAKDGWGISVSKVAENLVNASPRLKPGDFWL